MKHALVILLLALVGCTEPEHTHGPACETPVTQGAGIVIGDSIAEGHPALHGRHHGQCDNQAGQVSYHLEQRYQTPVLNQGIGGQTCAQILARWSADVDVHSPSFVWLSCGQNDIILEAQPLETIERHTREAIAKAEAGGYRLYVQTLGYQLNRRDTDATVDAVNALYASLQSPALTVVDYAGWSEQNHEMIPDGLHPSREGYTSFFMSLGL